MVNDELYRKIRTIRQEMGLTKRYCFATRQFLGDNGKLEDHELYGTVITRKSDNKTYTIDSVCLHWLKGGWYYAIAFVDANGSHGMGFIKNVNCEVDYILKGIDSFNERYTW
jgi:hypothetical protein